MAFVAALWTGCEDDKGGETPPPPPPETALSNLNGNVALPEIESARLDYRPELSTARTDTYFLTLSVSGFDASLRTGRGVRFELSVDKGGSPFGRYLIGDGGEPCVPGALDGEEQRVHSWYVDASGQTVVEAPLCSGLLDLTKVLGKKPGNTYYQVSFTAYDDQSPAYSVNGKFSGDLTVSLPGSGSEEPAATYVYAGVSGYSQEEGYTTWAIDFDNESFTKHLGFMSINADPGIAFEEGIPAGRYVIAEDDEPGTITWPTYDDLEADLSMIFLESGTVDVSRDGDRYTVVVDATDEYGDPFRADFEGQFYYENVTEKSSVGPVEAYAVWYGAKEGTTYNNWYITLVDNGYLTTADAVGNYYYVFLNAAYGDRSIDGIQYVQEWDNSFEVAKWIIKSKSVRSNSSKAGFEGRLQYMRTTRGDSYNWTAGVEFSTEKLSDIYYFPRSTQDIENCKIGIFGRKNFIFNEKHSLLVGIRASYKMNNSSDIDYNGYKADTKCYTDFTLRDYYYLGSGYAAFGGEITYSFARLFKGRGSVFAAASGDYVRADDHRDLFDRRFYANFKIGLMF